MRGIRFFDGWADYAAARPVLERHLPASEVDQLEVVYRFAADRHRGQTRIGGEPYITHPLQVLEILVVGVGSTDPGVQAAALLHDVVEDTPTTLDEIAGLFGADTAELVRWLTDPEESETDEDRLRRFRDAPPRARLVKLADRLSNVQRLDTYPDSAVCRSYYLETVAEVIPLGVDHPFFGPWYETWRRALANLADPTP